MNKINTYLKSITKSALSDFVKDQIKVVIALISLFVVVISREQIIKFLVYEIQIWKGFLFLFLFSISILFFRYVIFKKKHKVTRFGLLWEIVLVKNKVLFLKGPFCPDCDCDVSHTLEGIATIDGVLRCPKCQKEYPIKATSINKIKNDVKEIIESDLKSNKIIDVEWNLCALEDSSLKVKNKGIFEVTDLNISVSAIIDEKTKIVGEYYLGNITPLDSINLESELTQNIKDLLLKYNLITIGSMGIPDEGRNHYGEKILVGRTYEFNLLKKEFKSTVFVDLTYKLEKKQKSQRNEFLLDFISKNWIHGEVYYYLVDDFDITLRRIN